LLGARGLTAGPDPDKRMYVRLDGHEGFRVGRQC
jgi:hypothetical protein